MRALVFSALGLAVVACSPDGETGIGDPCSLESPCGEGVCNLSGAGAPVCIDQDGDVDGDGLANKSDFCNQKAGGAFDEDGDLLGDDCDPCPIAPPPKTAETDGDDVDGPCDPDPSLPGNKITLFEGFNSTLPAAWIKEGGTWEARGGEAIFTATDPNAIAILKASLPIESRHLAVQTSYRIDRVDAATQNLVGVVTIDPRPAAGPPVSCSGSRIGGMDSLDVDSGIGNSTKPFTNLFDPAGLYRLAQLIENATGACAMRAPTQDGAVSASTSGDIPTIAGLRARAVSARFQYLLFVQRPN